MQSYSVDRRGGASRCDMTKSESSNAVQDHERQSVAFKFIKKFDEVHYFASIESRKL